MKTYHIFISHSWNYADEYKNLVNLLDQAPRFDYSNFSIPKDDPVHTKSAEFLSDLCRIFYLCLSIWFCIMFPLGKST